MKDYCVSGNINQAAVKVSRHNYSSAQNILDSIPHWFRLNDAQHEEVYYLNGIYTILGNAYNNNRKLTELTQAEQSDLSTIALADGGSASVRANELLCFF